MDTYRVLTREPGPTPDPGKYCATTIYVQADSFTGAVIAANAAAGINSVIMEVALSRPLIEVTDHELSSAIDQWLGDNGYDKQDVDDFGGYMDDSFTSWVSDVIAILRDSGIAPEITISLCADGEGVVDYSMIELYGHDGMYRAKGADIKHLTNNREAVGMAAVLDIARSLISFANYVR
jgi:hypothetical protein